MKQQNDNDAQVLDLEFFTEEQLRELVANDKALAAIKWCSGKITDTDAGNWCSSGECKQQHLNKKYYYRCDGDKCPIQANKWYLIPGSCSPGGQKYLSSCKVYFGSVDACS